MNIGTKLALCNCRERIKEGNLTKMDFRALEKSEKKLDNEKRKVIFKY